MTLLLLGICGTGFAGWQARAALPRWMQDVVGASAVEAALYRAMQLPGLSALYPRPPQEAQGELNALIEKTPKDAELLSLRAMEEEQALDFSAAEADWKSFAAQSRDAVDGRLQLANYYHRRMQTSEEVAVLMQVGTTVAQPMELYVAPAEQRSWQAFERLLSLATDQGLDGETTEKAYAAWIARYPAQPSLFSRELHWLLERKSDPRRFDTATALVNRYRQSFPQDTVFPLKASALIEYRRGSTASIDKALAIYDSGFEPLWPAELVQSYYALLAQTHTQRRFVAAARARLAQNPDDLNAMARLFYYAQQEGNLPSARQIIETYRVSKESRKAAWSAQELYTLARLTEAISAYPEAARYNFALYHASGAIVGGASPQETGLSGIVRILLNAPDAPVELGSGNLSMYRDIATLDQGPGYWNGILSLWLNSTSPERSYHEEEQRARPYFHRAKAVELLAQLDRSYPKASERAELHKELIRTLAEYGESALVLKSGDDFLNSFHAESDESNRVLTAMYMADAFALQKDTKGEFALYDQMLAELSTKTAGMPLTAAAASNRGAVTTKVEGAASVQVNDPESDIPTRGAPGDALKTPAFDVTPGPASGVFVAGSQEYQQLLERYLGRLTSTGQLPQALAVLRRELDRNPNDPLLYERLASFLQQNNMSAQQEEVYNQAIQKFQDKSWYDKLARLYLREKKREAFASLTRQVTGIFHGTDLEQYFQHVKEGGPQLFLQLNLYAHERFPHDQVFIQNLLQAYLVKSTRDPVARDKLLREHWSDTEQLRRQFFDALSRSGRLDAELAKLHQLVPGTQEQKANPAASRELAEAEMWRSHFEESAAPLRQLAEQYPADEEVGTQASSVLRSLAYYEPHRTDEAVAIEKHLIAASPSSMDRLARIGDIYADSGADGSAGHENIAAAAPYWRHIPALHPGSSDGYLQAATIFWDYFQFDDALEEIHKSRLKFAEPALYGYEAGAIDEGKRDLAAAVREYTAAASESPIGSSASRRLLQLARRKGTAKLVDDETAQTLRSTASIGALQLRDRVLKVQKHDAEVAPLLEDALAGTTTFAQAQAISEQAQADALTKVYELAIQREIALAIDPVQKIELSYELVRSYESRKDLDAAAHIVESLYRDNRKLLGVVRSTTDFYWRNKQQAKAIATLIEASKAAQPVLSRQFLVEAADKSNDAGDYAQARSLMAPLIDTAPSSNAPADTPHDPYNAQYLGVVADSYARAGDDAGLKRFYLARLDGIHASVQGMSPDQRKQKTVLLRRGLIPALTRMKDYAGAVEQYTAILSAYPEDAAAISEASLYALRYSRQQQLVEFVETTVKASPRDARFAIMLAQIETTYENYPAAIDAYAHAITIRSDRLDVYAAKADLEERLQRLDDACKDYERLYGLSYRNPDWMLKVAAVRARQGRKPEVVKALERAWMEGHIPTPANYFQVARQLESWHLMDDALHFAELGVKAEGDTLLTGRDAGSLNGYEPEGAVIYARLMTQLRRQEAALKVLDAARNVADTSPDSPGLVVEQVEKQGLASVTNSEWRKHRLEQRKQAAEQRYQAAVVAMGKTAGLYFTPQEKQQFARLVDTYWIKENTQSPSASLQWIDVAKAAGLAEEEAALRKQVLLQQNGPSGSVADAQFSPYVQLERSRMAYAELAQTLEAYASRVKPEQREAIRIAQVQAYRDSGDEAAELRVLRRLGPQQSGTAGLRDRTLQLLLKRDLPGFESYGVGDGDEATALAAPNFAVEHSDFKVSRASLKPHAQSGPKALGPGWENAYASLLGLYFRDRSPATESAFHAVLADERSIGQRIDARGQGTPTTNADPAQSSGGLAGDTWFYYGMRYGVYRTLASEREWVQRDPENYLAAGLERSNSPGSYITLARAYEDAGKSAAALLEYRHALELTPDLPAVHDAIALLEWKDGKKAEAIGEWRSAFAALNRIQDKGAAPESFWTGFALIAQHIGARRLTSELRVDMDPVLRTYLARNGDYRSDELLKAVYESAANPGEGTQWLMTLANGSSVPAGVLSGIDNATWLPREAREPIYLREIQLARIAAAEATREDDYTRQQLIYKEKSLVSYYVALKQDAKAEALLQSFTDEQRRDKAMVTAQIILAARAHTLDVLLAHYREHADTQLGPLGSKWLHSAAATMAKEGDPAGALAIWQLVFDRGQADHDLMASDYLGLAAAQLEVGNTEAAVALLQRMALMPGDVYVNYDHAASLLEEKHRYTEAIAFLAVLAKGEPWNASFSLRLALAQLQVGTSKADAITSLTQIASDNQQPYDLRIQAVVTLQQAGASESARLGSSELNLLASGQVDAQQARQPYFAAARVHAATAITDMPERASLLREAIAINPAGFVGAGAYTGYALRFNIFRTEAALGHNATALDALGPLLNGSILFSAPNSPPTENAFVAGDESIDETVVDTAPDSTEEDPVAIASDDRHAPTREELERLAPLPQHGPQSGNKDAKADAEELALSLVIAQVYEATDDRSSALPYLSLAAFLQTDKAARSELERKVLEIRTGLAVDRQNALRMPAIRHALDQSNVVRPRISAKDVNKEEAAQ